MEEDDKGCPMIRMSVSGWKFLLVPAYPGSPGQKAVKRLCVCVCYILTENASVYLIGCIFIYISLSGEIVKTGMVVNAVICC